MRRRRDSDDFDDKEEEGYSFPDSLTVYGSLQGDLSGGGPEEHPPVRVAAAIGLPPPPPPDRSS